MSRIDDLVRDLCPSGVHRLPMAAVGTLRRGKRFVKADLVEEGAPCIHYGEIYTRYGTSASKTYSFLRPEMASRLRTAKPGELIIASTGETVEDIGKAVAWAGDQDVVIHDACYAYDSALDAKYVAYALQTADVNAQMRPLVSTSKVSSISISNLGKVRIPVPPLEVQAEIVRVLDTFQSLEAELRAQLLIELDERKRQYDYYRDLSMTFPELGGGVEWVSLGEVGTLFGGLTGKAKADFQGGNARYVSYTNVLRNLATDVSPADMVVVRDSEKQRRLQRGDILFTGSSETPADVGMSSVLTAEPQGPLYLNSFCIGLRLGDTRVLDPEFSKHLFRSATMRRSITRAANGVTRFNLSKGKLAKVRVPIPSFEQQRRIAEVCDDLDAHVNNLSAGLRAELVARRQQYEHYRDGLFAFEEAA